MIVAQISEDRSAESEEAATAARPAANDGKRPNDIEVETDCAVGLLKRGII